jgi:hypothetical protein
MPGKVRFTNGKSHFSGCRWESLRGEGGSSYTKFGSASGSAPGPKGGWESTPPEGGSSCPFGRLLKSKPLTNKHLFDCDP